MAEVLTEAAVIVCAHQGKIVATATQFVLTIQGNRILLADDLAAATIPACPAPDPGKCKKVTAVSPAAASTVLTVGGKPVALRTGADPANTTNAGTFEVSEPGQNVLEAT